MADPTIPANQHEDKRTKTQEARDAYDEARQKVRDARTSAGGTPNHYEYLVQDVTAAAVELMLSGLDEYLAAGAADRADQVKARWVMIGLTVVIALVTVVMGVATAVSAYSAFKKQPVPPSPINNITVNVPPAPAPIIQIQPVPVTVTLTPPRAVTKAKREGGPK